MRGSTCGRAKGWAKERLSTCNIPVHLYNRSMKKKRYISTIHLAVIAALLMQASILTAQGEAESTIPLSRVALFSSGVGYFQRDGHVEGNSTVELKFVTSQINDILKSLILRDFDGGNISRVNFSSRDPLAKTLKSFTIDLADNPGLAAILNQARGEAVELTTSEKIEGRILGVERVQELEEQGYNINLITARGLQSIRLVEVTEIRFLKPSLEEELHKALSLIAEEHNRDKKNVVLHFTGQGKRRVSIGYLVETPVWKTSYRLVLGDNNSHFLQGWAIVENTTDEDWQDVELSLVSGEPISFTMDLYRPIYLRRPHVELDIRGSVQSQVYDDDLGYGADAEELIAESAPPAMFDRRMAAKKSLAYSREEQEMDLTKGVESAARAGTTGEFYQYRIKAPVTIARQESAMLPIVSREIEGERISIYNEGVYDRHPLNGLLLKNSTEIYLTGGPITVFDQGTYAGDSRILLIPPGGERLISYSVDLDTEVKVERKTKGDTMVSVKIIHGNLFSKSIRRRELTYIIKNRGARERTILLEQPVDPGWQLATPAKAEERTRSHYRFKVKVGAAGGGNSEKSFKVVEEKSLSQTIVLSNMSSKNIEFYLKAEVISKKVKDALAKLSSMKARLYSTEAEIKKLQQRYRVISTDQKRIRDNMYQLNENSKLYKRYVATLSEQEDEINNLLVRIEELENQQREEQDAVNQYLLSLDVE